MTETSSTTNPGNPYGASGATGQPKPPSGAVFFDWVRSLGFVRGPDRWLAGVCGAVATRTGLDPLVVRGIAIVIAILGGPIFFLYAVGWALMPDQSGRSLVEQAARQVFEPAMIAVGALLLLTFIPWMQGIWWQGPPEIWGMPGWLEVLLRTSWAIGLTVGIILLVIYIAQRMPSPRNPAVHNTATDGTPTATFAPPIPPAPDAATAPSTGQTAGQTAGAAPSGPTPYAPYGSGPRPATPAAAFDPDRYRPDRYQSDRHRTMHRRRQLGAGFVSVVAGIALSVGAIAASVVADGTWSNTAYLVGAAAALTVVALGIVVAGIRGREGGWLNFFSIALAVSMAWTAFIPAGTDVVAFGDPTWQYNTDEPTGLAMIAGAPTIDLTSIDSTPSGIDRTVDVWLAFGDTRLILPENRTVEVQAGNLAGGIDYGARGQSGTNRGGLLFHDERVVVEGTGTGVTTVRVWTGFGQVTINQPAEPALR